MVLGLFITALLISTALTWVDVWLPWSTSLVVAAYGLTLWYHVRKQDKVVDDNVRDSPYYLGFLLTFISLFVAFYNLPEFAQFGRSTDITEYMIRNIGSALLTTVVGVVFRFVIMMTDVHGQRYDSINELLLIELKKSAAEFKEEQIRIVEIIRAFIDSEKHIIMEHQQVSEEFVQIIRQAINTISSTDFSAIAKVGGAMQVMSHEINESTQAIKAFRAELPASGEITLKEDFAGLRQAIDSSIAMLIEFARHSNDIKQSSDNIHIVSTNIHDLTRDFVSALGHTIDGLSRVRELSETQVDETAKVLRYFDSDLKTAMASLKKVYSELDNLATKPTLLELHNELEKLSQSISAVSNSCEKSANSFSQMHGSAQQTSDDLTAIDNILDQFIDIAEARITSLSELRKN